MNQNELFQIVSSRYPCRMQKDEVVVQTCLMCGNPKWNLELQAEYGVYHCWACKGGGTLRSFLSEWCGVTADIPVTYEGPKIDYTVPKDHLDISTVPVDTVPSARAYLEKRGVRLAEMYQYDIRFSTDVGETQNRILLPVREYYSQRMFGYVGRKYIHTAPGAKYMATFKSVVVAGFRVFNSKVHVVVEGFFDALAVRRAQFNAAAVLGGASGEAVIDAWAARLPENDIVIVLLDGDAKKSAQKLEWRIKGVREKVLRFDLPEHLDPAMLESRALSAIVNTVLHEGGMA